MTCQFESEDGCDAWIFRNLQLKHPGFFVDCGAAHPEHFSQTCWLRALGWKGLAIDGTPEYAKEWEGIQGTTFINAVLSEQPQVRFINERTNALVSRIHPEGDIVNARMLSSILLEFGVREIDFLAIDIEGSEYPVLAEMFYSGFKPKVIVAEYNSAHSGCCASLIELIIRKGYTFVHMTGSNGVFVSAI